MVGLDVGLFCSIGYMRRRSGTAHCLLSGDLLMLSVNLCALSRSF